MAEASHSNFQSCCRLCLTEKLESLKSVYNEASDDRSLPEKILQFVAVEINVTDKLSTMICDQCILKVNGWHNYKEQCAENQSKLVQWLNIAESSCVNGLGDVTVQIKEEPRDVDYTEHEHENSDPPLESNVEVIMVKPEPMDQPDEPMEEEYNELPPPLTPYAADSNLEIEEGIPGSENSRRCSICNKLFSSSGNRRKHEKQIHGLHKVPAIRSLTNDLSVRKPMDGINNFDGSALLEDEIISDSQTSQPDSNESDIQKIQYAAGLKLIQTNSTPISMEPLSKIELSYIEKCKAMVNMHKTLSCACHNVPHPNLKGLLSHLRALRIWFPVFTCYNCMITFTDRSTFTKHSVRCPKPSLDTITKLSNLRKRSEVKTRLYQNFRCTYCKFMYSFHDDFIKHVDEDHSAFEPPIVCTCSRRFDNLEDYKDHVYVSCLVEYYCDVCFITTRTLDDFQKHAVEIHDNSEGFILLQDDNYKMRKPSMHIPTKEVVDESVILTGKRERRMSVKAPNYVEDDIPNKVLNPAVLSPKSHSKTCPLCYKEYSSYNNMMRHYRTHLTSEKVSETLSDDDSYYSCPECGGMYNSAEWQIHLAEKHDPKTCLECGKTFQFQSELENHRSAHLNLKVYRDSKTKAYKSTMLSPGSDTEMFICEICDMIFTAKEELLEHNLTHESENGLESLPAEEGTLEESEEEQKFACKPCKKVYASYAGIWDHNKRKHPEKKTPFESAWPKQCTQCDKVCTTGAAYHRHKMIHEKDRVPSENAPTKIPIIKNKRDSENEEEESYHTCRRCFKVFSSRYNLKNHMRMHGVSASPSGRKQVRKGNSDNEIFLKLKQEQYTDDETTETNSLNDADMNGMAPLIFTCDVCVMTFTTKMALKRHKEKHTEETRRPQLKPQVYCKYCKIPFNSVILLTKHMHEEHDETAKPKVSKSKAASRPQFSCHICKKTFQTASALTTHVGWHKRGTGDPNNKHSKVLKQNKIIDKIASAQATIKQEPIEKPKFQCTTCLAGFPNDTALQVHILEKHRSVSAVMLIPRCNTCNKDFETQDEYETHKRLHDFLERQKQHEQAMLLQQNEQPSQNDVVSHTQPRQIKPQAGQQKSFPCKYCNAGFSRSDTLGTHIRVYHKEFVQTEFKCTQCDRMFDKQNSLTIHLKVHEKSRTSVTTTKPLFSCSICNMGFDLPKDLRAHTITAHPF